MLRRVAVLAGLVPLLVGTLVRVSGASSRHPAVHFSSPPVGMSYYDDHLDAIVATDVSSKAQAASLGINYAPTLRGLKAKLFPAVYLVKGPAADGQLWVLGAEPGEDSYAPLWIEVTVRWSQGAQPVLLTSDTQIDQLASQGELTQTRTKVVIDFAVIATNVAPGTTVSPPAVLDTFYDGHRDGMLATDVSTKPQAKAEGINYSAVLAKLDPELFPELYIVRGRMAAGQLMILGSEPGEPDYSPIWRETVVRWRPGATPVVIESDTQVDKLIEAGKVTERETTVRLNCPVVGVHSGSVATASSLAARVKRRVRIVDFAFTPRTVTIARGTRVRWTNTGSAVHTSTSNTGTWDSGTIAPGASFSRVFRRTGTFRYHCSIHPNMKGKIVVT